MLPGALRWSLMRLRVPSLISPPERASPSLPEPAPVARERLLSDREGRSVDLSELTVKRTLEGLRWAGAAGRAPAESGGGKTAGDLGREGGPLGVDTPVWRLDGLACFFLCFLREDSLPLASEILGEPGRFRELEETDLWLESRGLLGRFEGVFVPLVELPEPVLPALSLSLSD